MQDYNGHIGLEPRPRMTYLGQKIYHAVLLMYKPIIKLQGVKANQILYRTPKNQQKEFFFDIFFQKARAWLSTPAPKWHNVLIVSQRAITPVKKIKKMQNINHETRHKNK